MVFPIQQQRNNFYPNQMNRSSNNFGFPQPTGSRMGGRSPNKNNIQGMLQRFIQPQSGGGVANLTRNGGGGLSQTLNSVQQVLKVVQTTTPIIQEYGPMVKNLPAMYRMMKAFKEIESTDKAPENDASNSESISESISESNSSKTVNDKQAKEPLKSSGQSTPKLYI